jgi:hypothetical protein
MLKNKEVTNNLFNFKNSLWKTRYNQKKNEKDIIYLVEIFMLHRNND